MFKLSLKIGICTTLLIQSVLAAQLDGSELPDIIERAAKISPLALKALQNEAEFRQASINQINALRQEVETIQHSQKAEDSDKWKRKTFERIEADIALTAALNKAIVELKEQKKTVTFPVSSHKIGDILNGVRLLLTESFDVLLDGQLPKEYTYNQQTVTMLGGENYSTVWGNSRRTILPTALMYIIANGEKDVKKGFDTFGLSWYDKSALAHVTALPEALNLDLTSYSFYCPYEQVVGKPKFGLIVPHSGYAFGGHRCDQWRYPNGKKFGPQDCSSYLSTLTGSPAYTTADQLCAFRRLANVDGFVPEGWEKGSDARYLLENSTVVAVKDPSMDIQAGQIYCHRTFPATDTTMTQLGNGGHTAVVMGYMRDGNIVTMGANRNMPTLEGIGIQNFTWAEEPLKKKMLFTLKDQ